MAYQSLQNLRDWGKRIERAWEQPELHSKFLASLGYVSQRRLKQASKQSGQSEGKLRNLASGTLELPNALIDYLAQSTLGMSWLEL